MEPKTNLKECTIKEITAFIDMNVRKTSPKTGKKVKINTFKWSKEMLYNFIKGGNFFKWLFRLTEYWTK